MTTNLPERLLLALQGLSEYDLTFKVIQPLMSSLGYDRLEYYGGPDEEGKDLICWRVDELGDNELAVVQVKRYKPTRKAADRLSFSEIVTQLSQAVEKEVPSVDAVFHLPRAIYFITPFQVDSKVLKSRIEKVQSLKQHNIKIIDGPRLANLVLSRLPKVTGHICGRTAELERTIIPQLNNDVLMRALDARPGRDIRLFYTDLDFAMGRQSNRLFFLCKYEPKVRNHLLKEDAWRRLCLTAAFVVRHFNASVLTNTIDEVEAKRQAALTQNNQIRLEIGVLENEIESINNKIGLAEADLDKRITELRDSDSSIAKAEGRLNSLRLQLEKLISSRRTNLSIEPDLARMIPMTENEKLLEVEIQRADTLLTKKLSPLGKAKGVLDDLLARRKKILIAKVT
jgi:hypothetical protein